MNRWIGTLFTVCLCAGPALADAVQSAGDGPPAEEKADHDKLIALREDLLKAFNKRDLDGLVKHLHPKVVVTWQNGEVSRGPDAVRKYNQKMLEGPGAVVDSMTIDNLKVDDWSILYGKDKTTAVAWGNMDDKYKLKDGMAFDLHSRWTVTLVKEGDRWLIAAAHMSGNVFENQVMGQVVQKVALWTGIGAAVVGLAVGIVVTLLLRRRRPAGATPS
jgi:ketosteroid isomerase-like protein